MMSIATQHVLGIILIFGSTYSFPNGGDELLKNNACKSMAPGVKKGGETGLRGHTAPPQNTIHGKDLAPFYVHLYGANHEYEEGVEIPISLMANQSFHHQYYKGVFVQARKLKCKTGRMIEVEDEAIGTFEIKDPRIAMLTYVHCGDILKSAISHKSRSWKTNETATWLPDSDHGHVVFKATFVQDQHDYWTEVYSPVIYPPGAPDPPTCASHTITTTMYCMIVCFLTCLLL